MRQASHLKDFHTKLLRDGIVVNTTPTDWHPIKQMQLLKFDGQHWAVFGDVIG